MRWTKVDPPLAPAGDVGGDRQATEAYSARFRPAQEPADGLHALVTDCWYGEATGRTHREGPLRLACQREHVICADPRDPGSTEVWADASYRRLDERYATPAEAETAARARAAEAGGDDIGWDGRSPIEPPLRPWQPLDAELDLDDDGLDLTPPAGREHDAGLDRGR